MSFGVMGGDPAASSHTNHGPACRLPSNLQAALHAPRWRPGDGLNVQLEHEVARADNR